MRRAPAVLMHLERPRPLLLPQLRTRQGCCPGALIGHCNRSLRAKRQGNVKTRNTGGLGGGQPGARGCDFQDPGNLLGTGGTRRGRWESPRPRRGRLGRVQIVATRLPALYNARGSG